MAGWDTQQQLDGLPGILNLAAASGEDLGTVSDIVTDAMTAFGMEAAQAGEFADVLAAAASNSNTNVSMLGESFKYVAPVAGALGFEAKDAATALGLMANAGIKGSQAGTAMRTLLTNLVKPTKESGTAMNELGISLTDADGNMKELSDVMGDLRGAFRDLDPDQQAFYAAQIAGQQGMSGLLAIVNAAEDDFNDLSGAINNSTGEAERMAAEMQDNLAGRLTELKSALEGLALQIYDVMLPALEGFVAIVQRVVDWFSELSPGMQRAIVVVGALVAAIGPVLIALGAMSSGVGVVMGAVAKLTPYLPVLKSAIAALTGPIGLVIAAIAAAVAIGWYLHENWGEVKELVTQLWEEFKEFWVGLWEGLKTWFVELVAYIAAYYIERWNELYSKFQEILTALKEFFTGAWESIRDTGISIWEGFRDGVLGIWSGMVDGIKGFINLIIRAVNGMVERLNRISFSIPDWVPVLGGKSWGFNLPKIPELAEGGIIQRAGMALVGEAGPELLNLPRGAQVTPLPAGGSIDYDALARAISRYIKPSINIENHFTPAESTPAEHKRKQEQMLRQFALEWGL